MNARSKLNQAYVNGALLMAGLIAAVAESWSLFFLLTAILIGLSVHSGEIRPQRKQRPQQPQRNQPPRRR